MSLPPVTGNCQAAAHISTSMPLAAAWSWTVSSGCPVPQDGNAGQTRAQWLSHLRHAVAQRLPQLVSCFTFCEFDEVRHRCCMHNERSD